MTNKLLFLCTGNYFRSRFAEIFFNTKAEKLNLNWRADSRGFATYLVAEKMGPISRHTIQGLLDRGISPGRNFRAPLQLQRGDLEEAGLIIAIKEAEHRPFLRVQFPDWVDQVEYWNIHDLDRLPPEQSLATLECEILNLIKRLS